MARGSSEGVVVQQISQDPKTCTCCLFINYDNLVITKSVLLYIFSVAVLHLLIADCDSSGNSDDSVFCAMRAVHLCPQFSLLSLYCLSFIHILCLPGPSPFDSTPPCRFCHGRAPSRQKEQERKDQRVGSVDGVSKGDCKKVDSQDSTLMSSFFCSWRLLRPLVWG
jgi:hypothetical protein